MDKFKFEYVNLNKFKMIIQGTSSQNFKGTNNLYCTTFQQNYKKECKASQFILSDKNKRITKPTIKRKI
jgi:hypothetical protein